MPFFHYGSEQHKRRFSFSREVHSPLIIVNVDIDLLGIMIMLTNILFFSSFSLCPQLSSQIGEMFLFVVRSIRCES